MRYLVSLLLICAVCTLAAAGPEQVEFEKGMDAYKSKRYAEARQHFQKASDLGSVEGMTNLGSMLADGIGGRHDHAKGFALTQKAAEAGSPEAMFNLAVLYEKGRGTVEDTWQAREWYRKALAAGVTKAKPEVERYAVMEVELNQTPGGLESSRGLTAYDQDKYDEALAWWEKAAAKGNAEAMHSLARLHRSEFIPKDIPKALAWLEKAAKAGEANAMADLGEIYAEGAIVPRDLPRARAWYAKAIAAGRDDLADTLKALQ